MNVITGCFLAAAALTLGVQLWLHLRQRRALLDHRDQVPAGFEQVIDLHHYRRGVRYRLERLQLSQWEHVAGMIVLLLWTLGGGLEQLVAFWQQSGLGDLTAGTGVVISVVMLSALLMLPFRILRTFGIDRRHGFSQTSAGLFLMDQVKGLGLILLLGAPLAMAVLWLMSSAGPYWWIWAWALWMACLILASGLFVVVIAPLFHRLRPVSEPTLRRRLKALLLRHGYRHAEVHEMDGSRRNSQANAFFAGLGRARRVVLYDTLIARLTPSEIEAVIAHELGHDRLHHVPQALAVQAVASLAGFAALAWLAEQPAFFTGLGLSTASDAGALALVVLLSPLAGIWLQPFVAALSRRFEREADDFAARETEPGALRSALLKLYRHNAGNLISDPWYAAFYETHPGPAERVSRLANGPPAGLVAG